MTKYRVVEYEKLHQHDEFTFQIQRQDRHWFFWKKWVWADDVSDGWFKNELQAFNCLADHKRAMSNIPRKIKKVWNV